MSKFCYKFTPQYEVNSGEILSEPRRSLRIKDILERAQRGSGHDTIMYDDDELPGNTPEELDDWVEHSQYEPDLNDAFDAVERVRAAIYPVSSETEVSNADAAFSTAANQGANDVDNEVQS